MFIKVCKDVHKNMDEGDYYNDYDEDKDDD